MVPFREITHANRGPDFGGVRYWVHFAAVEIEKSFIFSLEVRIRLLRLP